MNNLASDEEAPESWDSTSDGEADTTLVEEASDEEIVTVCQQYQGSTCPTLVVYGGMTDNIEKVHASLTFVDPSSTGENDRKATTESINPLYKETVIIVESSVSQKCTSINPESPDSGLGLLFKADNISARYFNLQTPPAESGTTVLCVTVATVRRDPYRRQWDPGILSLNKGIKTMQMKKNETDLSKMKNDSGSAQSPGYNYKEDLQLLCPRLSLTHRWNTAVGRKHPNIWYIIKKVKKEERRSVLQIQASDRGDNPPPRRLKYSRGSIAGHLQSWQQKY
ncbi:unnamed protein product [Mytilus coruscus]|uniref:Uncharacterized protein n=1 Tax=Mytilus coruscus TaxID=42192 RepID=A0A6J8EBE0_MYTCO|nr:unnamed protein product [Mytilus coruscus]